MNFAELKSFLIERGSSFEQQEKALWADLNATLGALSFCREVYAKLEEPSVDDENPAETETD